MNLLKIKETCLYIQDLEKARQFYHEKLGLPLISYVANKHIFFRAGSSVLLCFNPEDSKQKLSPPGHFGGGKQHFAFEVKKDDYIRTREEIANLGIEIIDDVTWSEGTQSFYFNDPEGNILEVVPDRGLWD